MKKEMMKREKKEEKKRRNDGAAKKQLTNILSFFPLFRATVSALTAVPSAWPKQLFGRQIPSVAAAVAAASTLSLL
jgi:hypothetical protein